jgi:hypothetical protein
VRSILEYFGKHWRQLRLARPVAAATDENGEEMQQSTESSLMSFIPLLLMSLLFGFVGYFLAKDKGRPPLLWTVLCLVPFANLFFLTFLVGSTSLRIVAKLDALLDAPARAPDYR